jgi:hypothetical protein
MPKRTNPFQELVAMIQRAFAPAGAKITESALVNVPFNSDTREIDVLIEAPPGSAHLKIAVEAKDEGRKMDSTKFESLLGKYLVRGGVEVDKLIVITHRGFSKPVIQRAKLLGIELFTLNQAFGVDWANLYPQKLQVKFAPHLAEVKVEPEIPEDVLTNVLNEGHVYCLAHGTDKGTLPQFIMDFLARTVFPEHPNLMLELEQKAASEPSGQAKADFTLPLTHQHIIRFGTHDYPLGILRFAIHLANGVGSMKYGMCNLTSPDGKTTGVPYAEAVAAGKKIRFVMPEWPNSPQIIMRVDDADPGNAKNKPGPSC